MVALVFVAFPAFAFAQDKPDTPAPKVQTDAKKASTDPQGKEANDEVPKRIFWIVPNFMTGNDQPENQGPLTNEQKFNIAWHQFIDPSAHIGNLIQAGISQAANGLLHYGQGWGAFGERFAAQEGDQFTGSMLIYGIIPSLIHQDPRYFRKGKGSLEPRGVRNIPRLDRSIRFRKNHVQLRAGVWPVGAGNNFRLHLLSATRSKN